ncbi:MAG: A/G-specific adenine glycosylase [Clostridia bacterium]|nr:A/G-specific adenine glycosylase [Clostridia bacterium]
MKDQALDFSAIVDPLLSWYADHRRSLPWRDDPTPYHVWLSEIMLQQTRIEAVLPYYHRFLAACPDVASLAAIDDDALMKLWQGLGYYSRARNLKKAAQVICEQHGGIFPADYGALRALPGVGDYTAGAIASIAFGLAEPAVDGNVLRVIMRLSADNSDILADAVKKRVRDQLRAIYPSKGGDAAAMTQALMELGQRVCIPNGQPHCDECPLGAFCMARVNHLTDSIPYRAPKKPRRIEKRTVFLLCRADRQPDGTDIVRYAIRKRASKGLLASLWEFPSVDGHLCASEAKDAVQTIFEPLYVIDAAKAADAVHIFTHIEWHMCGYCLLCQGDCASDELTWATADELRTVYALPSAFRAYLGEIK